MPLRPPLPIDAVLPEICKQLAGAGALVLQAEPGAGKTTRVPPALLDAGLAGGGEVLVLEPRRVAARSGADFVAAERGEKIGESVGYQVRFERSGGAGTRLWFVTEGIAVRRLVGDPFLEKVGVLVLDEFHERHLPADIVLALARELRRTVRADLKVLVMSATLDVDRIARFLDGCPIVRCPGRVHPVEIEYRSAERDRRPAGEIVAAVRDLERGGAAAGDVLVFLPGLGEIRRTSEALAEAGLDRSFQILPLHGDLPLEAQRRVLRKSTERRIILSTNVAESSVTVDGVTAVIDSGLARVPEVDVARGVERLRTVPISIASADQRAGRAGRQAPGRCIRLWSRHDQASRREREVPEIRRLDLTTAVLELRAWGLRDLSSLAWLDPPPPGALEAAEKLLGTLGALDRHGAVTAVGRGMIRLPAPPRAARLLIEAARLGHADAGALWAALLSEREISLGARGFGEPERERGRGRSSAGVSDLLRRAEMYEQAARAGFSVGACRQLGVDASAARAVDRAARHLLRALERRSGSDASLAGASTSSTAAPPAADEALLRATFLAFSDRLVRRRTGDDLRGVMVGGGGVRITGESCVQGSELLVAIEARGGERRQHAESSVSMASAVERAWLDEYFPAEIETEQQLEFDHHGERVVRIDRVMFRGLVLSEARAPTTGGAGSEILLRHALARAESFLELSPREAMLLRRVDFAAGHGCPTVEGGSRGLLQRAITSICHGVDSFAELRRLAKDGVVEASIPFQQRREIDRLAPDSFRLPSGRLAHIDYGRVGTPAISARIQELFGLRDSPRIAGGAVAVAVEILGPNRRPVQVTDDLASFWVNTYPEIRKQLRGRYPKHAWPETP